MSPTRGGDLADVAAAAKARVPAVAEAATNVARLHYLDGGHGDGCNEDNDAFTLWRQRFHQFTLHGFLLCFRGDLRGDAISLSVQSAALCLR